MSKVAPTPDYADEINRAYANGCAKAKAAIADIKLCGDLLIAQKARMKHGEFIPWVKANCTFSHDSANVYMRVALDPNYEHARNLSLREFLEKPKLPPATTSSQQTPDVLLVKPQVELLRCSFCGKSQGEVRKLITDASARCGCCGIAIKSRICICDECVELWSDSIGAAKTKRAAKAKGRRRP